jgi:hypothetical protein
MKYQMTARSKCQYQYRRKKTRKPVIATEESHFSIVIMKFMKEF